MAAIKTVDDYINNKPEQAGQLKALRQIMLNTELEECIKWGAPVYMIKEKNVIGLGAFKSYTGIWFFNGVFLTDDHNQLVNAQKNKTKALRQWRFQSLDEIQSNLELIKEYVEEAIQNQKEGKELKPTKQRLVLPDILKNELKKDQSLHDSFEQLSPGKQKEYANHISEAKRESTRQRRLEKIIPMIKAGKGLYDKYKNC